MLKVNTVTVSRDVYCERTTQPKEDSHVEIR
jgi:hypothetical protein